MLSVANLKNKSDAFEGLENSLSKNSQNSLRNKASKSSSPLHKCLKKWSGREEEYDHCRSCEKNTKGQE